MESLKPVHTGSTWKHYSVKDMAVPKDLDSLPYPAWDLFLMNNYWESNVRIGGGDVVKERYAVMMATRGCHHSCSFCYSSLMSGYKGFRYRSNESIINEIKWLIDKYDVEEILFVDDNFFVGKKRVKSLLKLFIKEFPKICFQAVGGTEVKCLDKEMIDLMADANFHKVLLSIEAADEDIQKFSIDKNVPISKVTEYVDYFKSKKVEIRALFMMGFPGETRQQIEKTVRMARELNVDDFYLSIVTS